MATIEENIPEPKKNLKRKKQDEEVVETVAEFKPKRSRSAYHFFVKEYSNKLKDEFEKGIGSKPDFRTNSAVYANAWKALPDKSKYRQLAELDLEETRKENSERLRAIRIAEGKAYDEDEEPFRKKGLLPKRPMTAYHFFVRKISSEMKDTGNKISFKELSRLYARTWNNLEDKSEYLQLAQEDKDRYNSEMKTLGLKPRKRRRGLPPKRPNPPFLLFCKEQAPLLRERENISYSECQVRLGKRWRFELSDDEKKIYKMRAAELHRIALGV